MAVEGEALGNGAIPGRIVGASVAQGELGHRDNWLAHQG